MPDPKKQTISATEMRLPLPSVEELNRLFRYDADTGCLYWRRRGEMATNWNARFADKKAGREDGTSGVSISINSVSYLAHRLIFKMLNGYEPPIVDHQNRDRSKNTGDNLRPADKSLNGANSKDRERDLPRGVFRCSNSAKNPYRAQLKSQHLGVFPTAEAASDAFKAAVRAKYGEFANA
jgi:HNH endonuclease